jgi:hypothetical protein
LEEGEQRKVDPLSVFQPGSAADAIEHQEVGVRQWQSKIHVHDRDELTP